MRSQFPAQLIDPLDLTGGNMALMIDRFQDVRSFRGREAGRIDDLTGHGIGVHDDSGQKRAIIRKNRPLILFRDVAEIAQLHSE